MVLLLLLTETEYLAASPDLVLTKENNKEMKLAQAVVWTPPPREQAAKSSSVCCSFLRGTLTQPGPHHAQGESQFCLFYRRTRAFSYITAYQPNAKAIRCPHFYSQFCYKFEHFSEDGLLPFPEHSITVTSDTENHSDKCPIYREMNSHKVEEFFLFFPFLSSIGEENSWINFVCP